MSEENFTPAAEPSPAAPQASELQPGQTPPVDGGAQPEGEGPTPEQQAQAAEEEANKKRQRFDRRFSDLSSRAREAELRAARLEGELNALRSQSRPAPQEQQPAAPEAPKGPPNPKDYAAGEYDPRYAADLAKHEIREEQRAEAERQAKAQREAAAREELQKGFQRFEGVLDQAEVQAESDGGEHFARAPEVLRYAARHLPASTVDLITESENPVWIAEVIGRGGLKDMPLDLQELRGMSHAQAARAIARIDAAVSLLRSQRAAAPAPAPRPAPQPSPAPIPTVTPSGAAPQFNAETATPAEVEARLRALQATRAASWGG